MRRRVGALRLRAARLDCRRIPKVEDRKLREPPPGIKLWAIVLTCLQLSASLIGFWKERNEKAVLNAHLVVINSEQGPHVAKGLRGRPSDVVNVFLPGTKKVVLKRS